MRPKVHSKSHGSHFTAFAEEETGKIPEAPEGTKGALPGDGRPFETVYDPAAEDILKLAERLVADARKRLGDE